MVPAPADDDHCLHNSLNSRLDVVENFVAFSYQSSLCLTLVVVSSSSTGCVSEGLAVGLSQQNQDERQTVVCNTIHGSGVSVAKGFVH